MIGSESEGVTGILRGDGSLEELRLRYADGWQTIEFRRDTFRGPGFDARFGEIRGDSGDTHRLWLFE